MSNTLRMRGVGVTGALLALFGAPLARAEDCCRVVKTSIVEPLVEVRVCEPDAEGGCGSLLYIGALEPGDVREICSSSGTLVHQTYEDPLGGYGPPVTAACDGDVEL